MISRQTRRTLEKLVRGKVLFDEPMKNHTSFHIGGPAEVLIMPRDQMDLVKLVSFCRKENLPLTPVGNGTKLLVSDEGIDGVVVKISGSFDGVIVSRTIVKSGAGHLLGTLARLMIDYGLSGLEFAIGIPGTLGGAVVMNAGAHGFTIGDVIAEVTLMNFEGSISKYRKNDLFLGYRQSRFQDNPCIILAVEMHLAADEPKIIRRRTDEYSLWRKNGQPLDLPSAGSVFKNPKGASAGKLIDMVGLKGAIIGNAKISEKHANFILNIGNATAKDVMDLMKKAQSEVLIKYNILLEPEIRILGRFN